jgi:hypothetical protein
MMDFVFVFQSIEVKKTFLFIIGSDRCNAEFTIPG